MIVDAKHRYFSTYSICGIILVLCLAFTYSHREQTLESKLYSPRYSDKALEFRRQQSPPLWEDLVALPQVPFGIYSVIPSNVTTMILELTYLCQPECDYLFLNFPTLSGYRQITLYHRAVADLPWFYASDGHIQMFQRNEWYDNFSAYKEAGLPGTLLIEEDLALQLKLGKHQFKVLNELTQTIPETATHVITSYQFPKHYGNWYVSRKIPLNDVHRDDNNGIQFTLIAGRFDLMPVQIRTSEPRIESY